MNIEILRKALLPLELDHTYEDENMYVVYFRDEGEIHYAAFNKAYTPTYEQLAASIKLRQSVGKSG